MSALVKPTIHLNGSSPEALKAGYEAALAALGSALDELAMTGPNARDYYPQGDDAFYRARKEHDARMESVRQVMSDLGDLYEHVSAAIDERDARRAR